MARKSFVTLVLLVLVVVAGLWHAGMFGRGDAAPEVDEARDDAARSVASKRSTPVRPLQPGAVAGFVVTIDGQAVEAATVALSTRPVGDSMRASPGAPPRVVSSDAEGRWSFEDVEPGRYRLTATAADWAPATIGSVTVHEGERVDGIEIRLDTGGHALVGTIADATGGSIEGATVTAVSVASVSTQGADATVFGTISGEDGGYRLRLTAGTYALSVTHPDYAAAHRMIQLDAERSEGFRLVPGGSIEGVVRRSTDGEPVAEATVVQGTSMAAVGDLMGIRMRNAGENRIQTDASGRFRLSGLSPGIVGLDAFAEGHASVEPTEIAVGIAETVTGVELWIDPMPRVSGTVVWGDTRDPVPGATVSALQMKPMTIVSGDGVTGDDGRFQLAAVPRGTWTISAEGESIASSRAKNVTLDDEDVSDLVVEVERGLSVAGRVEPPGSATVVATPSASIARALLGGAAGPVMTTSAEDGTFELRGLARGTYDVTASAFDGRRGNVELTMPAAADLVVELEVGLSLSGTIVDTGGVPVGGVRVCAGPTAGQDIRCAQARSDGTFTMRGLAEGTYQVSLFDPSSARRVSLAEDDRAEVNVSAHADPNEVRLVVEPRDGRIEGVVENAEGTPLSDAWVRALPRDKDVPLDGYLRRLGSLTPGGRTVPVDADGHFVIEDLERGAYLVLAEAGGGMLRGEADAVQTDADVRITLVGVSSISGRVTGGAVRQFTLLAAGPSYTRKTFASGDGTFTLPNLTPGAYVLTAEADGLVGRVELELQPEHQASVDIALAPLGRVIGRAVDREGTAIAGIRVSHSSLERDPDPAKFLTGGTVTGEDGRFELADVRPGDGWVSLREGGMFDLDGRRGMENYTMEAGGTVDVGDVVVQSRAEAEEARKADSREKLGDIGKNRDLGLRFHIGEAPAQAEMLAAFDDDPMELMTHAMEHTDNPDAKLWIAAVDPGSVGAKAGFRVGDHIVSVGRSRAERPAFELLMSLSGTWRTKGKPVTWRLERNGAPIELEVVVPQ